MPSTLKLLLVEDSPDDFALLLQHFKRAHIELDSKRVDTEPGLRSALSESDWDTVICDYNLPRLNAVEAITMVREMRPDMPCIVVSGSVGEDLAVETMRAGASDFITKDNLSRLIPAIQRELREREIRRERKQIEEALRKTEENLRQAQRLESIGQLAGGIAHDFNNILATVLLQAEMLSEALKKSPPPENLAPSMAGGLEQIRKAGERATNLTKQLLAFGRKQVLQLRVLNVNGPIAEMEAMMRRLIESNIEIQLDFGSELRNVRIDTGQLEQIILNLVVNARDAMPEGGKLTITTRNSRVDETAARMLDGIPGDYVELIVEDTGMGMPDQIKNHIFEPFFTTKPIGKGTGLGLATVYGIVKQTKGMISVESEPGKGTKFKIFLPVTGEAASAAPAPKEISNLSGSETILVVEDEDNFRDLICEALIDNGYTVIGAANGAEAFEILKSNPTKVDLVLSDVVMPVMGGVELAKRVHEYGLKIPFIFQSGYTEESLVAGGENPARLNFIAKPYSLKLLLAEIRKTLLLNSKVKVS